MSIEHIESISPLTLEIYKLLKRYRILTRGQLVELTEKPRTTVYDNLKVLLEEGIATKFPRRVNNKGRPVIFFKIVED